MSRHSDKAGQSGAYREKLLGALSGSVRVWKAGLRAPVDDPLKWAGRRPNIPACPSPGSPRCWAASPSSCATWPRTSLPTWACCPPRSSRWCDCTSRRSTAPWRWTLPSCWATSSGGSTSVSRARAPPSVPPRSPSPYARTSSRTSTRPAWPRSSDIQNAAAVLGESGALTDALVELEGPAQDYLQAASGGATRRGHRDHPRRDARRCRRLGDHAGHPPACPARARPAVGARRDLDRPRALHDGDHPALALAALPAAAAEPDPARAQPGGRRASAPRPTRSASG